MSDALNATGRPIFFSLCEWGVADPWLWVRRQPTEWSLACTLVVVVACPCCSSGPEAGQLLAHRRRYSGPLGRPLALARQHRRAQPVRRTGTVVSLACRVPSFLAVAAIGIVTTRLFVDSARSGTTPTCWKSAMAAWYSRTMPTCLPSSPPLSHIRLPIRLHTDDKRVPGAFCAGEARIEARHSSC